MFAGDVEQGVSFVKLGRGVGEDEAQQARDLLLQGREQALLGGEDGLPVLLDDALVATDEARLERTRRVLDAAAASGLQLLLVTCHWPRLREAGLAPSALIDLEAERRRQERRAP